VLFNVDQEAYRDLLSDHEAEDETEKQSDETDLERGAGQ